MPSRKKSQGKARKRASSFIALFAGDGCNHGCPDVNVKTLPGSFVVAVDCVLKNSVDICPAEDGLTAICSCLTKFLGCPESRKALSNPAERQLIARCLTSLGTSYLLKVDEQERYLLRAASCAVAVFILSKPDDEWEIFLNIVTGKELSENDAIVDDLECCLASFHDDTELATLRFFTKRGTCPCLKAKYKQTKQRPKLAKCRNCRETSERKMLLECAGCRDFITTHYCSRDCQVSILRNLFGTNATLALQPS